MLIAEKLSPVSNIAHFDCGIEELNAFLKDFALLFQERKFGATLTFYRESDKSKTVLGYYTLSPCHIERDKLKKLSGPRPNPIPAFRLCRLAIDLSQQKKRYGEHLLLHALTKCLEQSSELGGYGVLVDAKNESAKSFYESYGFVQTVEHPLTLFIPMKTVERYLMK